MPRNFKEAVFFTALMCSMMVFGMSCWNLYVLGNFSWGHVFSGFLPGFIVGMILDFVLVGPLAKKFAMSVIMKTPHHEKRWVKIVGISGCMVIGMVTCMSLYGLIFNLVIGQGLGWSAITWSAYFKTWITNFLVAAPYNLLIVGPISRFILGKFQKPFPGDDKVEDFEDDEVLPEII
ncbi:DUF2798 domain-containing protein [Streptococcus caprae]|uniref:DUF2798 domain-containing protein n=1 Tax=Streptococcus caprae TaxID=1640501 RepID=A0ABV8CVZ0_9STRE